MIASSRFLFLQEQRCGERPELRSGVGNPERALQRAGEPAAIGEGTRKARVAGFG